MGRSNKEEREKLLGTGLLEAARRGLSGRTEDIDAAVDEASDPTKKKKRKHRMDDYEDL